MRQHESYRGVSPWMLALLLAATTVAAPAFVPQARSASAPMPADYPHATVNAQGQPLTGANRYVIRFPKGRLPPVNGFWSITMYNAKQTFIQNPIDRYAIAFLDHYLKGKPEGQLDFDGTDVNRYLRVP